MEDVKGMFQSKAIWGGIIAVLAGIAGLFGVQIDPSLQAEIATQAIAAVSVIGGALAIYGRLKATKSIGKP